MVTSSSTLAGYGAVGAGIPPYEIKDICVITKAYSSAVGAGEFVSEIFGDEADEMRIHGGDQGDSSTFTCPAAMERASFTTGRMYWRSRSMEKVSSSGSAMGSATAWYSVRE